VNEPGRPRVFPHNTRLDPHDGNFNLILDKRIRVTPVGRFHWDEAHRVWTGFAHHWNKFSKGWSDPKYFAVRDIEAECDHI
jgi:hypothetical protein